MNIIRMIIDRDCSVNWTDDEVISHVISRLKNKQKTFDALPLKDQKYFIKECKRIHHENQKLYRDVMYGV